MKELQLFTFKDKMETTLRELLVETLNDSKDLPEMMHGLIVMKAAGSFCDEMKKDFDKLKKEVIFLNDLSDHEYYTIIDDITSKVLDEFIEM